MAHENFLRGRVIASARTRPAYALGRRMLCALPLLAFALCVGCGGGSSQGPVSVSIAPTKATLTQGSLQFFTVAVNNSDDKTVQWQVNGITGGNSTLGTISTTGLYTAPTVVPSPPTVTVTAISQASPTAMAPASVTIQASSADPLGTITASPIVQCSQLLGGGGGVQGSTCYQLTVACPGVADQDVGVKVNLPATPIGTVLFTVGGGGTPWYDQEFAHGADAVNGVLGAGFATVQFNWGFQPVGFPGNGTFAGWLTGPGGVRPLSCRCATGNSGGSGAAAYALAHYGLDSMFTMLEETSGPVFSRIDNGCICPVNAVQNSGCTNNTNLSECYGDDAQRYLDPAYSPTGNLCSSAELTHDTTNEKLFLNDSILSPDAKVIYPNTVLHYVYGGQDITEGPPQGTEFWLRVSGRNGTVSPGNGVDCVSDAPHAIPDVADGAAKIVTDLTQMCHF